MPNAASRTVAAFLEICGLQKMSYCLLRGIMYHLAVVLQPRPHRTIEIQPIDRTGVLQLPTNVVYYDRRDQAIAANIGMTTEIVILIGYNSKHDGGGGVYRRVAAEPDHGLAFTSNTGAFFWELVAEQGRINLLQAGAKGDDTADDKVALQNCVEFVRAYPGTTIMIPKNKTFRIETRDRGIELVGDIRIVGEDRWTSILHMYEDTTASNMRSYDHLFSGVDLRNLYFANFTIMGQQAVNTTQGGAKFFNWLNLQNVTMEDMVMTRNRAVMVGIGEGARHWRIQRCLFTECRRGAIGIRNGFDIAIIHNTFLWIRDDAVNINQSSGDEETRIVTGGDIVVDYNFCLGCRGLNVIGGKRVSISYNIHVLGKGHAIHLGSSSSGGQGDTTVLDYRVVGNIIVDLLNPDVDVEDDDIGSTHDAIELEFLDAQAATAAAVPGMPASGSIVDPFQYYYLDGQGNQDVVLWHTGRTIVTGDIRRHELNIYEATSSGITGTIPPVHTSGTPSDGGVTWQYLRSLTPTPHPGRVLVESNLICRSRPPAVPAGDTGHVQDFDDFDSYGVGRFFGMNGFATTPITVTKDQITPESGIEITGTVSELILRANRIGNVDHCIRFNGSSLDRPMTAMDLVIAD